MNKRIFVLSLLIILIASYGCRSKEATQSKVESEKVDSLIKVLLINDVTIIVKFGYDAVSAIKTSKGLVLIDAGISTLLTERYKKIIINHFGLKNFCYVINSHGHHDHIRGNSLFPQAQIIGHEYCQKDVSYGGTNTDSMLIKINRIVCDYDQKLKHSLPNTAEWEDSFTQKIRYMGSYQDLKNNIHFRLPDIKFSDSLTLECGNTTFEMIYFGKFHSNSDILIYVPEIQVLFIGDLFTKYGRPSISSSSITDDNRWIHAIKWTNKRINDIRTIIVGHGQILTIDDLRRFNDNIFINKQIHKN
jgi:glyoxylase-like metal-dependent hydrolase (beta-lactamase superfamily II)